MSKKNVGYKLPEQTIEQLKEIAGQDLRSQSDVVRELIEKEAKKRGIK